MSLNADNTMNIEYIIPIFCLYSSYQICVEYMGAGLVEGYQIESTQQAALPVCYADV